MDSNLLKEAIADAKAVRQTALANAKAALTEAFGEQLSAMLAPTLEEDTMEQTPNGQDPLAQTQPPVPGMEQESVNEADIEEIDCGISFVTHTTCLYHGAETEFFVSHSVTNIECNHLRFKFAPTPLDTRSE